MSLLGYCVLCGVLLLSVQSAWADVLVQLNINRPINDVSDKFVSFSIKPEDLYNALDGSNRKITTRMASMLGHSRIKFVGDYYFAEKTEGIRLRNPTKIVWKGFNKWTKAVNWTMIIPVPYKPDNWDPMQALKILNSSQALGIDETIWQLGNDFGSARAADYVSELKTLNIMVDSFGQTVTNWQTMGADISAGSSPEETRRYVEMSRDLNVAYGWIQSEDMFSSNNVGSHLDGQDPALRVLFQSEVPVWLSLPRKKALSYHLDDEVIDGLTWAQTMGEAANIGFESIFKPLTLDDMEIPKYGFYVTALFKQIMGSRVYPARPLEIFGRINKLYTHCANTVSGGLAFMVVNQQETPLQIAVRSMDTIEDSEVWQYALTMNNGQILLNNRKLSGESSLMPEVKRKHSKSMLVLKTPGMSVSFWVLPNVNLEHCQFTEVESPIVPAEETNQKIKRYSSTDRLLKELIKEAAKPPASPFESLIRRNRRSVDNEDRFKRFVLEGTTGDLKPFANFAGSFLPEIKSPLKRDIFSPNRGEAAFQWFSNIFKEPLSLDLPLLKRNARQSNIYSGPLFMTRDGKTTAFTKKITEIKKPEKKVNKYQFEDQEFDEEKFFKNVGVQPEPDYVRVPEGDVFLSNIASVHGDEPEVELKIETKHNKPQTKEIVSEMKPLRLLPTEFFEALPTKQVKPLVPNLDLGSALNSLLFSDPFGKAYGKATPDIFGKNFDVKEETITKATVEPKTQKEINSVEETNDEDDSKQTHIDKDQKVLNSKDENDEHAVKDDEELLDASEEKHLEQTKPVYTNFQNSANYNYFGGSTKTDTEEHIKSEEKSLQHDTSTKSRFIEQPWWDLSSTRLKRSLDTRYPDSSWRNNLISKDDDLVTAANEMSPMRFNQFEHKVDEAVRSTNNKKENEDDDDDSIGSRIVKTFKEQVTKLVDIFSQNVSDWYNTLTKQLEGSNEEIGTESNRVG